MKRLINLSKASLVLFLLLGSVAAQGTKSINEATIEVTAARKGLTTAEQIALWQQRKSLVEQHLKAFSPSSPEYVLAMDWIRELVQRIEELKQAAVLPVSSSGAPAPFTNFDGAPAAFSQQNAPQRQTLVKAKPRIQPSVPKDGKTNEDLPLKLAWTEDHPEDNPCPEKNPDNCPVIVKTYRITGIRVELATDNRRVFGSNRFANPIFVSDPVASDGSTPKRIEVPKKVLLQSGQKYFWQVIAEYVPNGSAQTIADVASDAPASFRTTPQTFAKFEDKGLTLQRAVSGDDAAEGAQFGFLKTFNKKAVYTADFALIYKRKPAQTQETSVGFQASVQGNLTSAESESEDALQFRAGAVIDRNLKRNTINGLYVSLAGKYEADQKFKIGKLISENMVTPTFPALGIGIPFGRSSRYFEFRWRPFLYFDVGRSFKKGNSAETQDTVLRLTPRVTAKLTLKFLRQRLNLNDASIFVDNYFYYLPLENTKKRHEMFTSGFTFQMTKTFGFGVTYKNGESAPKFKRVNTLGGVLTIKFGKDE